MSHRLSATLIPPLLALESLYFFFLAFSFARLFRGASNVGVGAPLPSSVWRFTFVGLLLLTVCVAYAWELWSVRKWFRGFGVLFIAYGTYTVLAGYPLILSWSGAWHGDVVALGVLSGVLFIAIGVLSLIRGE